MTRYVVKAWSNEGPYRLPETMTAKEALKAALALRDRGFTHIALTDLRTGREIEVDQRLRRLRAKGAMPPNLRDR